nr:hypothetical protein [Tanacetum cinerariifolium]
MYGDGKPSTCIECKSILKGGFCLPCDLRDQTSYNCDSNAYSFDNSNNFLQPQYENYLCNLCGNNSHDGYDCQQKFLFVYEQEPSYNQNYDDNYYPHESPSFSCCDYCGGSHETYQCQPDNQNVDFSGPDQIQTPQYPEVYPLSEETSEEVSQAKEDLITSIQTFLDKFSCMPFEEQPKNYFQTRWNFFNLKYAKPEDSNEWFQKLLEDLNELAEYDKYISKDHPIILSDDDEGHYVKDKESLENPSNEIVVSKPDNESEKEPEATTDRNSRAPKTSILFHALDTKLLSINSKSQHPDKKEQEVKNVEEQSAERRNHAEKSLQNFRVIHKNSTSQISSVHADTPILSTKEPEHSLSMGYEHLSITSETESDEVTETNAKNLLPIPSECEVTSEDESECNILAKDDSSLAFTTFSNPLFDDNDDLDSSDNESLSEEDVPVEEFKVYSNHLFDNEEINSDKLDGESDFVESLLNRETFIDSSSTFDFLLKEFSDELAHINPVLPEENLLYDNSSPRPPEDLNAEIADTIIESLPSSSVPIQDNDSREEINLATDTDELFPPPFENDDEEEIKASDNPSTPHPLLESPNAEPDQESMNDTYDNDPFMKEGDLFLATDHSITPCIENYYDTEGDICFLEALLIDDFIPSSVNETSDFEDDPSIPRPPPEPPDDEFDLEPEVISTVMNDVDELNEHESFDPGGEIFVSTNDEDVNCFPFMFVIRIFMPYLILPEISPLFLSAESEDTIFDPGLSLNDWSFLVLDICPVSKIFISFD